MPSNTGRIAIHLGDSKNFAFGDLKNAPNGHVTYYWNKQTLNVYVDGRTPGAKGRTAQGTFLFQVLSLDVSLPAARYLQVINHGSAQTWDRDYLAFNGLVPGLRRGELIAFCDGEYHADFPVANQFISSVGVSSSIDGVQWSSAVDAPLVVQGLDVARNGLDAVASAIRGRKRLDSGASGPSAVVAVGKEPSEGSPDAFVYVFYADRTVMPNPNARSGIHVARVLQSSISDMSAYQKWQGTAWGPAGGQKESAAVVMPPAGSPQAVQPDVTWNKVLRAWLMIYRTNRGLYAATSPDLVHWTSGQLVLGAQPGQLAPSFPSLISPDTERSSRETDGKGLLFYSVHEPKQGRFVGYCRTFTIG